MNAGRLDIRVNLLTISTAPNSSGDAIETTAPLADVWASHKFLKGREMLEAKEMYSEVECVFEIRYSNDVKGLTSKDVIVSRGLIYDIIGDPIPVPGGRPTKLVIYTKRRPPELALPGESIPVGTIQVNGEWLQINDEYIVIL